jgi:hypothetical protein
MKRPPAPGEAALIHRTLETGHVQAFAICAENFDPGIVDMMPRMEHQPLIGYRLAVQRDERGAAVSFGVIRDADGEVLTRNAVRRTAEGIELQTAIVAFMPPKEAFMVADLEQCAAVALAGIVGRHR